MQKIKVIRAPTKAQLMDLAVKEKGNIDRMSYSRLGEHRLTIVFKETPKNHQI